MSLGNSIELLFNTIEAFEADTKHHKKGFKAASMERRKIISYVLKTFHLTRNTTKFSGVTCSRNDVNILNFSTY